MSVKRHSLVEIERVVGEYERSGLTRQQFSTGHGLKIYTLDAWRQRVLRARGNGKIVPVELINDSERKPRPMQAKTKIKQAAPMRVVLERGLRIEIESGFDATELRRLIAALGSSLDQSRQRRLWPE